MTGMSSEPVQVAPVTKPQVVKWFRIYTGFMAFIYLVVALGSLVFFFADPSDLDMSGGEAIFMGSLMIGVCLVLFVAFVLPLFVSPRPWLWTYDLVMICVGMSSACFLPVCIPLLIYWLKPETKAYFGKG